MLIRDLEADDLPQVHALLETPPWNSLAGELRAIAAESIGPPGREHEGLCSVTGATVSGVVLFRFVAGAVHAGEIECVAATEPDTARALLDAATAHLQDGGARIIVAEYPGSEDWEAYARLLATAGFVVQATVGDYFSEGVALTIAVVAVG
jgi:hypothetical protein